MANKQNVRNGKLGKLARVLRVGDPDQPRQVWTGTCWGIENNQGEITTK